MPLKIQFTAIRANARFKPQGALKKRIQDYTKNWARYVVADAGQYPPTESPSYKWTYDLLRGWNVVALPPNGDAWGVQINNYARHKGVYYARFVVGTRQWPVYARRGWTTVLQAIKAFGGREAVRKDIQGIIRWWAGD